MARVQCFECEMPVVVDPSGRCPEGHDLGAVGERIEQSLGRAEPHPDEPQPWIAVLGSDEVDEVAADATDVGQRVARPISIGPESSADDWGSSDGLLQELHALHDADGGVQAGSPAGNPPRPASASPGRPGTAARRRSDGSASDRAVAEEPAGVTDGDTWESTAGAPDSEAAAPQHPTQDGDQAAAAGDDGRSEESTPTVTPRRAPNLRSEEGMSAIAELSALLDDDGPSTTPPRHETPAPERSDQQSPRDHLATVSQLPVRQTEPEGPSTPPPPPPAPRDAEEPRDMAASGESIDWANFTSKGKKRRFGR